MKIGMVTSCYKPVVNGVTHMVSLYKQELEALGQNRHRPLEFEMVFQHE